MPQFKEEHYPRPFIPKALYQHDYSVHTCPDNEHRQILSSSHSVFRTYLFTVIQVLSYLELKTFCPSFEGLLQSWKRFGNNLDITLILIVVVILLYWCCYYFHPDYSCYFKIAQQ